LTYKPDGPGATPLPITFVGLAIASTLYAGFETGFLPKADFQTIGWLVLAIPVPMQVLAAVWGLVRGELAAATGSAVLAATWLGIALATLHTSPGEPGRSKAEALMLFVSAAALLISVTTELIDRKWAPALVLLVTAVRFATTGVSGLTHAQSWATAAGVVGFVVGAMALAGAFAVELRSALG
jgi:succinate-acetate transporter protein